MSSATSVCGVCQCERAKYRCEQCRTVHYCSAECQRSDWLDGHHLQCIGDAMPKKGRYTLDQVIIAVEEDVSTTKILKLNGKAGTDVKILAADELIDVIEEQTKGIEKLQSKRTDKKRTRQYFMIPISKADQYIGQSSAMSVGRLRNGQKLAIPKPPGARGTGQPSSREDEQVVAQYKDANKRPDIFLVGVIGITKDDDTPDVKSSQGDLEYHRNTGAIIIPNRKETLQLKDIKGTLSFVTFPRNTFNAKSSGVTKKFTPKKGGRFSIF